MSDAPARLHFNEDDTVAIECDQIEFSADIAMLSTQHTVAQADKILLGELFPARAKRRRTGRPSLPQRAEP